MPLATRKARNAAVGWAVGGMVTGLGLLLAASAQAAAPTLGLDATDAVIGQTVEATAQLSGGSAASGEISFAVYGPGDPTCAGPALTPAPASAPVSGDDEYTSGEFTPPTAGVYHWSAHYSGDLENEPADSGCVATSTVDKASPGIAGSASSATVGGAIHDVATLSGGFFPGGEITFSVYGPGDGGCTNPLATTSSPIASASATSANFSPQQAGQFRWRAFYPGDANNEAVSTACGAANQSSAVGKASPGLAGLATAAVQVGQTITDSATLSGGFAAGGQIVFRAYGPSDASCSGAVKYESSVAVSGDGAYAPTGFSPPPGLYRWTAEYSGDTNNEAASTICNAANQVSAVSKASPALVGLASSAQVGQEITDSATLTGGFDAGGQLVFRAYGPDDQNCSGPVQHEDSVAVNGDASYSPDGFSPPPGLYRWIVEYEGDGNNEPVVLPCNAANQASAVGSIAPTLTAGATNGTVGTPVAASATIKDGAIPGGQLTFKAFPPSDASCSGAAAFSSTVSVAGNGSYSSAAYVPSRVGGFRWTVDYSGDVNHHPVVVPCGTATSSVGRAAPTITGGVKKRAEVGSGFQDTTVLQGGFAPNGTITFRIYGPVAAGCAKPLLVNTIAVSGNGTFKSDPFVPQRPGRYSFVASYSGDAENQAASEPCDSAAQIVQVKKRKLLVKPRALLTGGREISIRARLSRGVSPSGTINFRLYGPGDKRCRHKPAFSGGISVEKNGSYSLAKYLASESGLYRLSVGYSGDQRNLRYKGSCNGAQPIRVG